jgi:hypothetical protein
VFTCSPVTCSPITYHLSPVTWKESSRNKRYYTGAAFEVVRLPTLATTITATATKAKQKTKTRASRENTTYVTC